MNSAAAKKKNLVLGILDNYSFHQVKKFFLSINKTGFKGDVCMFIGSKTSQATIKQLQSHGVKTIFFKDTLSLPEGNLAASAFRFPQPMNYFNYRHYLYYDFLQRHHSDYEYVLLTDVRDVYFQRDPFDFPIEEGLYCALEGKTKKIRDCSFNRPWVEFIYGKQGLDEIGNEIISCAGTSWGSTDTIQDYLQKMLKEIEKLPDAKKAIDQAIHNYLIHKKILPAVQFLTNDSGVVLTLSYEHNYTIGDDNLVRASNGRIVNILHQFDRMPDLKQLTDKLYMNKFGDNIRTGYYRFDNLKNRILRKLHFKKQ